jgi:DNA-directed RNA polymerase specialized sigma24 family protein
MRRFGSADLATEVLHEAYLRLGTGEVVSATRNPDAYLYRAVLNVAADSREDDRRWVDKATLTVRFGAISDTPSWNTTRSAKIFYNMAVTSSTSNGIRNA